MLKIIAVKYFLTELGFMATTLKRHCHDTSVHVDKYSVHGDL